MVFAYEYRIAHIARYRKFFHLRYIQVLCLCRLGKADRAYLMYLVLQRQLSDLTGVSLTTAKFKPLIFSVSGFSLSYTANMFILMILYALCLSPEQFYYIIMYIGKVGSCVKIADRRAPWKFSNIVENLVL
jgi:hypothetical protein